MADGFTTTASRGQTWTYDPVSGNWIIRDRNGNEVGRSSDPPRENYRSDAEWEAAAAAERQNEADAAHDAEWDAMSWEERQAARGRGESRSTEGGGGTLSEFDRVSADIPIWGDLSGARSRRAALEAENERRRRDAVLGDLADFMPEEGELSVEYGNEDWIGDTTAEGARARENLMAWSEGGLTDADRAMMEESRRRTGMAARASREADLSALEARGMGGSGASLAAMLSAGEGAADRNASMDATMMGAAQQRQIGATGALGEFAEHETDYGREREGRNTDRENRTRESASEAAQRAHENRERFTAMSTGMNPYGGGDPNEEEDEGDEAAGGVLSFLGDLF